MLDNGSDTVQNRMKRENNEDSLLESESKVRYPGLGIDRLEASPKPGARGGL